MIKLVNLHKYDRDKRRHIEMKLQSQFLQFYQKNLSP